ncbi:MAG TPA: helix-turn-helix transcriptional regulator [Thermoanaerobaculia bacterium]|nr:helix-turn-helix transcriptional regulator [Thermoanaerobaculia bacterium]
MEKESKDREEVFRILEVINTLLRVLGISNREVERRLGLHPSSLTRFFNGQVETKLEVVLGIARVIGLEYEELFHFAYPGPLDPESESPTARTIRARMQILQGGSRAARKSPQAPPQTPPRGSPSEAQAPSQLTDEDVERIARAVEKMVSRPGRKSKAGNQEG